MEKQPIMHAQGLLLAELDQVVSTLLDGSYEPDDLHELLLPRLEALNTSLQSLHRLQSLQVLQDDLAEAEKSE